MRALHLPGVPAGEGPLYSFPHHPPPASALEYTPSRFPDPRPDEKYCYLVRVLATSFTRSELTWGEVLDPSRFKPYGGAVPCHDVVGIIEKVVPANNGGKLFREGDRVWGLIDFDRDGAAAEYLIATEDELCLPPSCPDGAEDNKWIEQLATLPLSSLTAWQAVVVHGASLEQVKVNEHCRQVLVLGSGAVATAAIELAMNLGHEVTVVASKRGAETLGDSVGSILSPGIIIHDGDDLISRLTSSVFNLMKADLIVDTMGGKTVSKLLTSPHLQQLVNPGAKFVSIAAPISVLGKETEQEIKKNCEAAQITCEFFVVRPNKEQLQKISTIVQAGKLTGYVDSVWPLEKGKEAMERVETRGAVRRGKVVVTI
jgi:NADPH:quinone reductase-like Zn-dependent oxidoreductase